MDIDNINQKKTTSEIDELQDMNNNDKTHDKTMDLHINDTTIDNTRTNQLTYKQYYAIRLKEYKQLYPQRSMTDLAAMVRNEWSQSSNGMNLSSSHITNLIFQQKVFLILK